MTTAIEKQTEKPMEFVPFGAADKIKLTVVIIQNSVCIPTKSGKVCTVRDAVRFMMLCQAQRLNPFAGDCFLCGYDGKNGPVFSLIVAHQSFLKRAETCNDYEGMESGIILIGENDVVTEREGDFKLSSEECVGGWARVHRKGRKPTYRRLAIAAMKPNYDTPFWSGDKEPGQIVKCAEADALRATFPTLLGGLYSGEELRMTDTITGTIAADIPAAALITQGADSPAAAQEQAPDKVKQTPQGELEAKILLLGYDFNTAQKFFMESNFISGADSIGSFAEVPTDDAKRVLRLSEKTLKDGLEKAKG